MLRYIGPVCYAQAMADKSSSSGFFGALMVAIIAGVAVWYLTTQVFSKPTPPLPKAPETVKTEMPPVEKKAVYPTDWSEEKIGECIVYMHRPSDFDGGGHCDAPGQGAEVTRVIDYHCEGEGCGWSYHPTKGYEMDANVSLDKKSIVWRRKYTSAAPARETYRFGYRLPVQVCIENCPPAAKP